MVTVPRKEQVMVEPKPVAKTDDNTATLESRVATLEDKVQALTKSRSGGVTARELREVRDRVEDIADHVYGGNVRPPLRQRDDGDYPATVVPTSADEGTEQYEKDVNG
jgi:hypothetical protein